MKKIISLLISLCVIAAGIPAVYADDETLKNSNELYIFSVDNVKSVSKGYVEYFDEDGNVATEAIFDAPWWDIYDLNDSYDVYITYVKDNKFWPIDTPVVTYEDEYGDLGIIIAQAKEKSMVYRFHALIGGKYRLTAGKYSTAITVEGEFPEICDYSGLHVLSNMEGDFLWADGIDKVMPGSKLSFTITRSFFTSDDEYKGLPIIADLKDFEIVNSENEKAQDIKLKAVSPGVYILDCGYEDIKGEYRIRYIGSGYEMDNREVWFNFEADPFAVYKVKAMKPSKVKVKAAKGKNTVSWNKIKSEYNVHEYYVYRSESKSKGYKLCGKVDGKNSFADKKVKKGKTYYYKVKGVKTINGTDFDTKYSAVATVKAK